MIGFPFKRKRKEENLNPSKLEITEPSLEESQKENRNISNLENIPSEEQRKYGQYEPYIQYQYGWEEYINSLNGSLYMYHGISIIEYGIIEIGGIEYFYVRFDINGREAVYVSSLP